MAQKHYQMKERDEWETPPDLVSDIDQAVNGIDLDPCSGDHTDIGNTNYTIETDGLTEPWFGTVFVNPPFSYKSEWLQKATTEIQKERTDTIVVLTPDGTDVQSWWHGQIAEHATYVCFVKGRKRFYIGGEPSDKDPPFGIALSVFGECPDDLLNALQDWGHVVKTVR